MTRKPPLRRISSQRSGVQLCTPLAHRFGDIDDAADRMHRQLLHDAVHGRHQGLPLLLVNAIFIISTASQKPYFYGSLESTYKLNFWTGGIRN